MKILIVDDEYLIRKALVSRLEKCDCQFDEILQAANGMEAFSLFTEHLPDIVITDIRMEGLSGLELIAQCLRRHSKTRFIVISGFAEFEYVQKALQLGAVSYLLKPITQEALSEAVGKAVLALSQASALTAIKEENTLLTLHNLALTCSEKALDPAEYEQLLSLLGARRDDVFLVAHMHLTGYSNLHFLCLEDVHAAAAKYLDRYSTVPFQILPAKSKKDRYYIFYNHTLQEPEIVSFLQQVLHRASLSEITLTLGLSLSSSALTWELFRQAQQALDNRFTGGNGVIYSFSFQAVGIDAADSFPVDLKSLENELRDCTPEALSQNLIQLINRYSGLIYNFDYFVQAAYQMLIRLNFRLDSPRWDYFKQQKPWTTCENKEEALSMLKEEISRLLSGKRPHAGISLLH